MENRNSFIILLFVCLANFTIGQSISYQYENYLHHTEINGGASMEIEDPGGNDPTQINGHLAYALAGRTAYVRLVYGRGDRKDLAGTAWTYTVVYDLEDRVTGTIYANQTLELDRNNDGAVYEDLEKYLNVSESLELRVTNVSGTGDFSEIEDFRLEIVMDVERYDYFDDNAVTTLQVGLNSNNHEAECRWQELEGAVAYDLEWVFVDALSQGTNMNDDKLFQGAGRVRLHQNWYNLDLIYPNGTVYYRVRGVGRYIEDVNGDYSYWKPGAWTTTSSQTQITLNNSFEENRNWSYSIVFAEDGKSKQSMSYYDDGLKPRQSQTNLNTDDITLVGEQFYDVEGRVTLSILPAPLDGFENIPQNSLYYHHAPNKNRLNVNTDGDAYSRDDYDKYTPNISGANAYAEPLGNDYGAARYFSDLNGTNTIHRNYIPDAKGYVFTQTRYRRDGTGRPIEQSGIGETFKLGGEHSVKYYSAGVAPMELKRLFQNNIGNSAHYKKVITKDANGQMSASYVNIGGQTVATALIGDTATNVLALDNTNTTTIYRDLMVNNTVEDDDWTSRTTDEIFNPVPNTNYAFSYDMVGVVDMMTFRGDAFSCQDCAYALDIKVIKPDGQVLTNPAYNFPITIQVDPLVTDLESCLDKTYVMSTAILTDALGQTVSNLESGKLKFDLDFLEIGTYRVVKELRLIGRDLDGAVSDIIDDGIAPDITQITEFYLSLIDPYSCSFTCDQFCDTHIFNEFGNIKTSNPALYQAELNKCLNEQCQGYIDDFVALAIDGMCSSWLYQMTEQVKPSGIYYNDATFKSDVLADNNTFEVLKSDGTTVSIPASADGVQNPLSNNDFIVDLFDATKWQDQWADVLVESHLEYCHVDKCQNLVNQDSKKYDARITQLASWAEAEDYFNNTYNTSSSFPATWKDIVDNDPFFKAQTNSSFKTDFEDALDNYNKDNNPNYTSSQGDDILAFIQEANNQYNNQLTPTAQWAIFIGTYMEQKHQIVEIANGCAYLTTSDAVVQKLELPSVTSFDDLADLIVTQSNTGMSYLCEQNVEFWYTDLVNAAGSCTISSDDEALIKQFLLAYCTGSAGAANPLGYLLLEDLNQVPADPNLAEVQTILSSYDNGTTCTPSLTNIAVAIANVYTVMTDDNGDCVEEVPTFEIEPCLSELVVGINAVLPASNQTGIPSSPSSCFQNGAISATGEITLTEIGCQDFALTATPSNLHRIIFAHYDQSIANITNNIKIHWINVLKEPDPANPVFPAITSGGNTYSYNGIVLGVENSAGLIISVYMYSNISCDFFNEDTECVRYPNVPFTFEELSANCEDLYEENANLLAQREYSRQMDILLTDYANGAGDCFEGLQENFMVEYELKESHYTLYYYDQVGNLVATVPPAGVQPSTSFNTETGEYTGPDHDFPHTLATRYFYNSFGQMIKKTTPDEMGPTRFFYDYLGRLRLSQNPKQAADSDGTTNTGEFIYSYVKHDALGRPIESGQLDNYQYDWTATDPTTGEYLYLEDIEEDVNDRAFPDNSLTVSQTTHISYDIDDDPTDGFDQQNLRNRVAKTWNDHITTRYSYNVHGVVEVVEHTTAILGKKRIEYRINLLSNTNREVCYQSGQPDQFYHRYEYDADNRITHIYTSDDGFIYDLEARYFYTLSGGAIVRTELGHDKVQAWDMYDNLQGWIKGVNAPNDDDGEYDPGKDGYLGGSENQYIARDEFAYQLGYFKDDYTSINPTVNTQLNLEVHWQYLGQNILEYNSATNTTEQGLFNGNIAYMITDIHELSKTTDAVNAMAYQYDQLHRIKQARSANWTGIGWNNNNKYDTDYSFDGNGNIKTLKRRYDNQILDDITYTYYESNSQLINNQLLNIKDIASSNITNTLGDIITGTGNSSNYTYDELGNLVAESDLYNKNGAIIPGHTNITWTLTGKVNSVFYTIDGDPNGPLDGTERSELQFTYDVGDNRLSKEVTDGTYTTNHFYMRDGSGNTMAVYKQMEEWVEGVHYKNTYLLENVIYGNERLGIVDYGHSRLVHSIALASVSPPLPPLSTYPADEYNRERGYKRYELVNHSGNVLAVVSDMVNGHDGLDEDQTAEYYFANVISASDYYPYGWVIPNRRKESDYRYGFNGQEQDAEWRGGQAVSFRFRLHDPRLGRFLSVDPLAPSFPWNSTYSFAENKIIQGKELEGLEVTMTIFSGNRPKGEINSTMVNPYDNYVDGFIYEFTQGSIFKAKRLSFMLLTEKWDFSLNTIPVGVYHSKIREGIEQDILIDKYAYRTSRSRQAYLTKKTPIALLKPDDVALRIIVVRSMDFYEDGAGWVEMNGRDVYSDVYTFTKRELGDFQINSPVDVHLPTRFNKYTDPHIIGGQGSFHVNKALVTNEESDLFTQVGEGSQLLHFRGYGYAWMDFKFEGTGLDDYAGFSLEGVWGYPATKSLRGSGLTPYHLTGDADDYKIGLGYFSTSIWNAKDENGQSVAIGQTLGFNWGLGNPSPVSATITKSISTYSFKLRPQRPQFILRENVQERYRYKED